MHKLKKNNTLWINTYYICYTKFNYTLYGMLCKNHSVRWNIYFNFLNEFFLCMPAHSAFS